MTIVDDQPYPQHPRGGPPARVMQADTLRLLFTYAICLVVVIGGGLALLTAPDGSNIQTIAAGFIGSALTFAFGSESSARATRAAAASTLAGSTVAPANDPPTT